MKRALFAFLCAAGCTAFEREAPPLPEALVVVDTNLPAPLVAGRLRVDLYTADGTWFDSSDFGRPDKRDWPASFSVFSTDESRALPTFVRVRVYPEGAIDRYDDARPRLVKDGVDVTPRTEPSPRLTVDRIVQVTLTPQKRGRLRVLLHGACVGTSAVLGEGERPTVGGVESCVATERTREPVVDSPLEDDLSTPAETQVGTWLVKPCPAPNDADPRVCVEGGATILGSRENTDFTYTNLLALDSNPPHVFGLSPFFIDRDELTVGELIAIVDSGYSGPLPLTWDGELAQPTATNKLSACTFSFNTKGREAYPVTCVGYRAARGICQYRGGDLPTEAQWEHVATIAGHRTKVRYPWGNDPPTCERAVFARVPIVNATPECPGGAGPRPLSEGESDVSPLGIKRLYGSLGEWTLDDAEPFASAAWDELASVVDPHVTNTSGRRVYRGSCWMCDRLRPTFRNSPADDEGYPPLGLRCAYPVASR
jgi:formylglycine-generating enzyme required for sulfatase activity